MIYTYLKIIIGDLLLIDVSNLESNIGRSQHLGFDNLLRIWRAS